MATLYDRLGVDRSASTEEIRRAWLRLARDHHPDFHVGADAARRAANEREMQSINEAWAVLGDPKRRLDYDRSLPVAERVVTESAPFTFVPFDDGDDEIDPRLLDDRGVEGTEVGRSAQMLPVVFLLGGILGVVLGVVIDLMFLVAVGIVGLLGALVAILVTPLLAISRSIGAERRG